MPQYGLTLKSMLETGNAIMPAPGREAGALQVQGQRGLPSETLSQNNYKAYPKPKPGTKQFHFCQSLKSTELGSRLAAAQVCRADWLWASTAPLCRGRPCNSVSTRETPSMLNCTLSELNCFLKLPCTLCEAGQVELQKTQASSPPPWCFQSYRTVWSFQQQRTMCCSVQTGSQPPS